MIRKSLTSVCHRTHRYKWAGAWTLRLTTSKAAQFCSALCSTFLAGCVTIQQPANGSFGVTNPTAATVTWFPDMQVGTFVATLDNVDVSGQFSVDYPNQKAAA